MLRRAKDLSGLVGVGGTGRAAGTVSTVGRGGRSGDCVGCPAQAATCTASRIKKMRVVLVTELDTHDVDVRCSEPASRHIQLVQCFDRSDVDAVIFTPVDRRTLNARFYAVQR